MSVIFMHEKAYVDGAQSIYILAAAAPEKSDRSRKSSVDDYVKYVT